MFLLELLPSWIFYVILFTGIVGFTITYLFNFIPSLYKAPAEFVSILLIVFGTYMFGAISNEESWQLKIKELEVKVAEAEAKSSQETVKVVEKVVNKTRIVRQKGDEIVRYVDREIVKYDSKCEIPKEVVTTLNEATESLNK